MWSVQPPEGSLSSYTGRSLYGSGVGAGIAGVTPVPGLLAGRRLPGKHGWVTVVVPIAAPGRLRFVLPTTELAPPTVAPTPGMPVAEGPVVVVPEVAVPVGAVVVVLGTPGMMLVLHGPEMVFTGGPTV